MAKSKKSVEKVAASLLAYIKSLGIGDDAFISDGNSVIWEGGPFEWAISLSMGAGIYAGEFGYGDKIKPGWEAPDGFYLEAVNSYSVAIYPA